MSMLESRRPRLPIRAFEIEERDGLQDTVYLQHYNMKYEYFQGSLKIHAGCDDKR